MPELKEQDQELVFALDIGTRSIIGVAGRVVDERLEVLAIEKEEHGKRAMLDGQIEDIDLVAKVARRVTDRMEEKLRCSLRRVCVAAAGRALRTEKGHFAMALPDVMKIDSDVISHLESGAVSDAESHLFEEGKEDSQRRFYLVGYTVSGYLLDHYPLATLKGHTGQQLEADVVATFLPSEVVESLYAVMEGAGLEVVSLTLEPIAALNAVIPADLRLLNLVLCDIGAGTSDIAVCRDGAVVGYTMATVAGDEMTEELMRRYLVNFTTAERMKMELDTPTITYRDVLGLEQSTPGQQVRESLQSAAQSLAEEIAQRVIVINGTAPSAMFLAGGGSKLLGLRNLVAQALDMEEKRVALAGNNFDMSAFSKEYELNDPEYATPLGIAVSAGLGLISDSYRIMLNGHPAKLFRSGTLTVLDLLMMNGYTSADLVGRTGKSLSVTVDGQRMTFRGESAVPCALFLNGKETTPSALVYAGDAIEFTPAIPGASVERTVEDLLGSDFPGGVLVNQHPVGLDYKLRTGDQVVTTAEPISLEEIKEEPEELLDNAGEAVKEPAEPLPEESLRGKVKETVKEPMESAPAEPLQDGAEEAVKRPAEPLPEEEPAEEKDEGTTPEPIPEKEVVPVQEKPPQPVELDPAPVVTPPRAPQPMLRPLCIYLNSQPLVLPGKPDGAPYYLMDLLDRSGIDFGTLDCPVVLRVNGEEAAFTHVLRTNDQVIIRRGARQAPPVGPG